MGRDEHDEVVLAIKSLEPTPCLEIHCHGGTEAVNLLIDTLERAGVKPCSWLEAQPGLLTGQRAIASLLVAAPTVRTAAILLDQYNGAFQQAIQSILAEWRRNNFHKGAILLRSLVNYSGVGRRLVNPWRVAIAGPPNAGKSSLLNAIAGYQRSIVSSAPGTTRDLVTTVVALDGWPVELIDTAGMRIGAKTIEREGVERAKDAIRTADLCIWVIDFSKPDYPGVPELPALQVVLNKIDLSPTQGRHTGLDAIRISALRGDGLDQLCQTIIKRVLPFQPAPGEAVPYSIELCATVEIAWLHYTAGNTEECLRSLEKAEHLSQAAVSCGGEKSDPP
jgi:tRNA modification GTPase